MKLNCDIQANLSRNVLEDDSRETRKTYRPRPPKPQVPIAAKPRKRMFAMPTAFPILKGIAIRNNPEYMNEWREGDEIFVLNEELGSPHAPGQFLRLPLANGWTANLRDFEFVPATLEEIHNLFKDTTKAES